VKKPLVVFSLLVITCSCGDRQHLTGPTTGPVAVRGRIVDFNSQQAVSGAQVVFANDAESGLAEVARATSDSSGSYVVQIAAAGSFLVMVDGAFAGTVRVTGRTSRPELFVNGGRCVSRYGTIVDARTVDPVAGAVVTVAGGRAVTDAGGWYRIDLGCTGPIGFNTTVLIVEHPAYRQGVRPVGRGIGGVERLDVDLERR
jgi:hypothetical protein